MKYKKVKLMLSVIFSIVILPVYSFDGDSLIVETDTTKITYNERMNNLEENYKRLLMLNSSLENYKKIYNSLLRYNLDSEVYLMACRYLYINEPTYDLALDVIERCSKRKEYKSSVQYYEELFEYEEFKQQSNFEKAKIYVQYAGVQTAVSRPNAAYKSLCKAIELAPDYPEPYYLIANMWTMYEWGKKASSDGLLENFRFCIAADYYNKALKMLKDLNAMHDMTDTKSNLDEKTINEKISMCETNFPDVHEVFIRADKAQFGNQHIPFKIGESLTIKRWGSSFTSVIRASKKK